MTRLRRALLVGLLAAGFLSSGPAGSAGTSGPAPAAERVPGVTPPLEKPFLVADGVVRRTLAYGTAGLEQTVDVYTPARGPYPPRPTVLLVHGGGWQIGDSTEWQDEAVALVREKGWTAASLNYRLAPVHGWPAQLHDAQAALDLLRDRAGGLGIDVDRIGALGDSAGGHLAALLGEPGPGREPLRSVVTWSGVNDLSGLTQQASSGGCATHGCTRRGVAARVVGGLMGCTPERCPERYAQASPAAAVTSEHAATLAVSSEGEQIDPRQAWVMDSALHRNGVPSRVHVLPGRLHARGFQRWAWAPSLQFLAATLSPETTPPYPRPAVTVTLDLPQRSETRVGRPVRLKGVVRPREAGSSVSLQVRQPDGSWRTARLARVLPGAYDTYYDLTWTPSARGTTVWRAVWRGSGAVATSPPRAVVAR
ncbi:MAG: Esterase/lipase [Frankiales bacterium]|nr:Esterase/lipase [Frankiales bacterium]